MGRGDEKARVRKRRMEQQGISGVSGDLPLPIVCGRYASENLQIVNFFIKRLVLAQPAVDVEWVRLPVLGFYIHHLLLNYR